MTNLDSGVPTPTEVEASPVVDGQAPATDTPIEGVATEAPPAEPEYDFLELDDTIAGKYVKVKVDGEEIPVPLNEALQGYQRQADYSRKTQEAARLREEAQQALRLQQAMQQSPGLTVQVLAQQAGVSVEEFLGMTPAQQQAAIETSDEDQYADPLERALAEERNARIALEQRIEQREADEYLQRSVEGLKQTYGIGDDEVRAVVGRALQMQVGPEAFPMIYQAMAYEKLQAGNQAQQEAAAKAQAEEAARQAAAARASQTIGTGTGATNTTPIPSANGITSPRDAVLAAFDFLESNQR